MYNIDTAGGHVVAADTQKSVKAIDQAVVSLANLCASIVEVSNASSLAVCTVQDALASASAGLNSVIASRAEVSAATRELNAIQRKSNLRETAFGCPPLGVTQEPVTAQTAPLTA